MIYLDNAATTFPKPAPVHEALRSYARDDMANPWKPPYPMAAAAAAIQDEARRALDAMFHGEGPERWAHAFNGTDATNMALKGCVRRGDRVLCTDLDHDSVTRPLAAMAAAGLITWERIPAREGYVDPEDVRRALRRQAALVVLPAVSNVLGTVQDVAAIGPVVREAGALFMVDAAQSAGCVPLDIRRAGVDVLAFSGHKWLFGPVGTGVLYVGPRADRMRPWREGDTGGKAKGDRHPEEWPYRMEGGTPNGLGIAGLLAGIAWTRAQGVDALRQRYVARLAPVVEWCRGRDDWRVAGRWDPATHAGILSLVPRRGKPEDWARRLGESHGIAVRGGTLEAPDTHHALGTFPDGTLRVSPGPFTKDEDIADFLRALESLA